MYVYNIYLSLYPYPFSSLDFQVALKHVQSYHEWIFISTLSDGGFWSDGCRNLQDDLNVSKKLRCLSPTAWKFLRFCYKNSACAIKTSEPFGISQSICTRTLRNLTRSLHWNPPEPHQASSPPKPSGTSQGLCTGTLRNLTKHLLRQNPPEPHKVSALEPSGTSPSIFSAKTLRNLAR